jgi:hypothetical protein
MFDKTFTLSSTDGSVSVEITAGTEGVRSIVLISSPLPSKPVTEQELIDLLAPAVKEYLANASPGPSDAA